MLKTSSSLRAMQVLDSKERVQGVVKLTFSYNDGRSQ